MRATSLFLAALLTISSFPTEALAAATRQLPPGRVQLPASAVRLPGQAPHSALPSALPGAVLPGSQVLPGAVPSSIGEVPAQQPGAEGRTALEGLAQPMPDFSKQGDASAGAAELDFASRVNFGKGSGKRDMPDSHDDPEDRSGNGRRRGGNDQSIDDLNDLGWPDRRPAGDDTIRGPDGETGRPGAHYFESVANPAGPILPAASVQAESAFARLRKSKALPYIIVAGLAAAGALVLSAVGAFAATPVAVPVVAAFGLMFGAPTSKTTPALTAGDAAPQDVQRPVEYVVILKPQAAPQAGVQPGAITEDHHLSFVRRTLRGGYDVQSYGAKVGDIRGQLDKAGLSSQALIDRGGDAFATYKRINGFTLRVDQAKADDLKKWLEGQGHEVWANDRVGIYPPVKIKPEDMDPLNRGPISMKENLDIIKAAPIHKIARQLFGDPTAGFVGRLAARLTATAIPAVKIGVIDTGVDVTHRQLNKVNAKNTSSGRDAADDDGHGSWVASMILNVSPWLRRTMGLTSYKGLVNGGGTVDDLLKSMTTAANDGNIVISNSWGSNDGDPKNPLSQMALKLAEQGVVTVWAAGNSGPGANTIGAPAIVYYKDKKTGAIRTLAVAAAGRDKKIAGFSSRGLGSRRTRGEKDYPARPDLTGLGYNTDGAWPENMGPDRMDPELGGLKAISGTSMSTPEITGAIALLLTLFGVTQTGDKLDAVINAVMSTLEVTGQGPANEGQGFLNVEAAYKVLEAAWGAPKLAGPAGWASWLMAFSLGQGRWMNAPMSALAEYGQSLHTLDMHKAHHREILRRKVAYNEDVDPGFDRIAEQARANLKSLEARFPSLKSLDSMRGRLWLSLRGLQG